MSGFDYKCVSKQENYNSLQRIANDYASSNEDTKSVRITGKYLEHTKKKITK